MIKNMNWGKGIVAGMAMFMLFIIFMCVRMFALPADEYDHHYYEKGLNFDKDYAKEKQVVTDHAQPAIQVNGKLVNITFTAPATGSIKFIRPSSQALDKTFPINTELDRVANVSATSLVKGRWHIVLEWQSNRKPYLYEKEVDIE
ncbi:nitrogen fixation protein FixH [Mucilaginibacter ginsenosidivorax]|uniref:Nitrogen fixation protein FixH n=2 Tax=Mucilaginibacter ginsenosidivorax TaxID=862126 RepID=A0A5B8W7X7_9SPHI|nr:nitrogen fixation protein FixH [Mucilaginibacter ginsenosidivorax]